MNKVKSIVLLFLMVGVAVGSTDFFLGSDGKHYTKQEVRALEAKMQSRVDASKPTATLRAEDFLLEWPDGGSIVNFGFSTQESGVGDSMAIWMQPLANAIVKSVGIFNVNFEGSFEFFLHESNYAGEVVSSACANAAGWVGFYADADGNVTDPDEGGTWLAGDNECFSEAPIGPEIWPGLDIGGFSLPLDSASFMVYSELDFASTLGVSDTITSESFFIDAHATRTEGWGIGALNTPVTPYHGFKYYEEDGTSGNPGWHIRTYGWMVYAMVEYTEDIPPFINYLEGLATTLSTDAREVEAHVVDENPTGGDSGVESVVLHVYEGNTHAYTTSEMTAEDDTTFVGEIPGFTAGSQVNYWVVATDVAGNESESAVVTYNIFAKSEDATYLMLFDGLSGSGYPSQYYFYDAYEQYKVWWDTGAGDIWAFGAATADLLDLYDTVIEIASAGPIDGNAAAVKAWLDAGSKNYVLAGDEVMGGYYGWPGTPVELPTGEDADADDFFGYLGVDTYNGDINYAGSGDQGLPWPVDAVEGDLISGDLFAALTDIPTTFEDPRQLMYDPAYEIGVSNWLDGFGVDETVTVAFTSVPRDTDAWGTDEMAVGVYKEDATLSNKVMFLGFDPLSLNSAPSYIWFGARPEGPLFQAMEWFGTFALTVDEEAQLPTSFALHQNYPNPFNPGTTINFEMPKDGQVTLSVYNMLGQKVSTLVNGVRNAGQHSITWNGMDDNGQALAAGLYMYRIDAGDYTATKKMVLLK